MNFNEKTSGAMYFFDHREDNRARLRILIKKGDVNTIRCTSNSVDTFSKVEASQSVCVKFVFEATIDDDENEL